MTDIVYETYRSLAEEVADREAALIDELPVDETAGLDAHLEQVVSDWVAGHKAVRTVPAVAVYRHVLDEPIAESVVDLLVGLDVLVNVLDDVIDTADLSTTERIRLTCNAAFATTLLSGSEADCEPDAVRHDRSFRRSDVLLVRPSDETYAGSL